MESSGKPNIIERKRKSTQLKREPKKIKSWASLVYSPKEYFSIKLAIAHRRGARRAKNIQLFSMSFTRVLGFYFER